MADTGDKSQREKVEIEILERYGLRWAVLAAWQDQLTGRKQKVPDEVHKKLEAARVEISSGCFSSCEVGCLLSDAEAQLVSADGSGKDNHIDFWIDLLGMAMKEQVETQKLLAIPAVKFRYSECGFGPCKCSR